MFNFSSSDDIYNVYTKNNPSSTLGDDTVTKYSISALFSSSKTTFNTFDFTYTHIGVSHLLGNTKKRVGSSGVVG